MHLAERFEDGHENENRSPSDGMSLQEIMNRWQECYSEDYDMEAGETYSPVSDEDEDNDQEDELEISEVARYREVLSVSPSFDSLISRIYREENLSVVDQDIASVIRNLILDKLGRPKQISRRSGLVYKRVGFMINWNLRSHLEEQQYDNEPDGYHRVLPRVVTLTGSPTNALATTCAEYMEQVWPQSGPDILGLICRLASQTNRSTHQIILRDDTIIDAEMVDQETKVQIRVHGNVYSIAEIGQQLAWLAGTLRSSPIAQGVVSCAASVTVCSLVGAPEDQWFTISYQNEIVDTLTLGNGNCWHSLFRNPVLVRGYPIPRRPDGFENSPGIEMSVGMMAALTNAKRLVDFYGATFIKGFSSMLMAARMVGEIVLWHHLFNPDGNYIQYSDPRVYEAADRTTIGVDIMNRGRHFIGWCRNVKHYIGRSNTFGAQV